MHAAAPAAADEKYNFERLQATTQLNKQPLLIPQSLELSPTEELTIRCAQRAARDGTAGAAAAMWPDHVHPNAQGPAALASCWRLTPRP